MILGIESSCDESALALYDREDGVVEEWVNSQIAKHAEYGGVAFIESVTFEPHTGKIGSEIEFLLMV